jgi:hypothetical protein
MKCSFCGKHKDNYLTLAAHHTHEYPRQRVQLVICVECHEIMGNKLKAKYIRKETETESSDGAWSTATDES